MNPFSLTIHFDLCSQGASISKLIAVALKLFTKANIRPTLADLAFSASRHRAGVELVHVLICHDPPGNHLLQVHFSDFTFFNLSSDFNATNTIKNAT